MTLLGKYGWNAHFEEAFGALSAEGLEPGRIIEEQRGMYRVMAGSGELRAEIAGRLRQLGPADQPAVGDWVAIQADPGAGGIIIRQVLKRQSKISRKGAGRAVREQVLAANLDIVFMVTSCNEDFTPPRTANHPNSVTDKL